MDCELVAFAVTKLHVDFIPEIKKEEGTPGSVQFGARGEQTTMQFSVNLAVHKDIERQFQMTIGVRFTEETKEKVPFGYQVEVSVIGVIKVSDEVPTEKIVHIAQLNGVNLLYGTIRGVVFSATGAFIVGPMMIKSLTAQEILGTLTKPPADPTAAQPVNPVHSKRASRKRRAPAQEGVAGAQKVLAALLERHDPPKKKNG